MSKHVDPHEGALLLFSLKHRAVTMENCFQCLIT